MINLKETLAGKSLYTPADGNVSTVWDALSGRIAFFTGKHVGSINPTTGSVASVPLKEVASVSVRSDEIRMKAHDGRVLLTLSGQDFDPNLIRDFGLRLRSQLSN